MKTAILFTMAMAAMIAAAVTEAVRAKQSTCSVEHPAGDAPVKILRVVALGLLLSVALV